MPVGRLAESHERFQSDRAGVRVDVLDEAHQSIDRGAVDHVLHPALFAEAPAAIATELEEAGGKADLSAEARELGDRLDAVDAELAEAALRNSIAGRIGMALEPVSRLAGFDWRTNIALVGGFAAKEVVVPTPGTAYSLGEIDPKESAPLAEKLGETPGWRPLAALSLIVFTMFYAPCFASEVYIARESGSWKWGAFSMAFNTTLAFSLSVLVYQTGSAFEL
jgi:ferrous iron transport protein B